MRNPNLLKPYLELCRRLGVRYVSLVPVSPGTAPERITPARNKKTTGPAPPAVVKTASEKRAGNPIPSFQEKPFDRTHSSPVERFSSFAKAPADRSVPQGRSLDKAPGKSTDGLEKPAAGGIPGKAGWITIAEDSIQAMELMAFEKDICGCQKCPLGKTRKNFVFGSGNPQAKVVFVGEAPGGEEDAQGLPFVGEAGKLLTKIIESTKLWKRSEVFIANILKCRPPGNRTPSPEEIEKCLPYLEEQIQIIKPKFIMAMGATAAKALLHTTDSVGKLRGKWHDYNGIHLRVTYHPAALLRDVRYKKDVWEDMKELTLKYKEIIK